MKISKLDVAEAEAKRFLQKVAELRENALKKNFREEICIDPGRYPATVKRASMDLSNALADLRRSDYK